MYMYVYHSIIEILKGMHTYMYRSSTCTRSRKYTRWYMYINLTIYIYYIYMCVCLFVCVCSSIVALRMVCCDVYRYQLEGTIYYRFFFLPFNFQVFLNIFYFIFTLKLLHFLLLPGTLLYFLLFSAFFPFLDATTFW